MRRFVSLGFSCQARFSISSVGADHRRLPFDYNITTKSALLNALKDDGEVFKLADETAMQVFCTRQQKREGVLLDGVFFWHDFPVINEQAMIANWSDGLGDVRAKYAAMWRRFRQVLAEPDTHITFVISNSQANLGQFADTFEEFSDRYIVTPAFIHDLRAALSDLGARSFDLIVLNRYLTGSIEINEAIKADWFRSVFVGKLNLPTHQRLAVNVLARDKAGEPPLAAIEAQYQDGLRVVRLNDDSAAILKGKAPIGEIRPATGGYIAVFEDGFDAVKTAIRTDDGALYWSDKLRWARA